jgi:hypothetical protein
MLLFARSIPLFTAVGLVTAAVAPQLPSGTPAAAPSAGANSPSPLELGVRLAKIALDGASVAAQQMIALELENTAVVSTGDSSNIINSTPSLAMRSVPNSSPSKSDLAQVVGQEKALLRPHNLDDQPDDQQSPLVGQIKSAQVSSLEDIPLFVTPDQSHLHPTADIWQILASDHPT